MKNEKTKKLAYASLAGITAMGLTACAKYEDGPSFSLRTKKSRLVGDWEVKSVSNETFTSDYSWSMSFEKDGTMKYTISSQGQGYSYTGKWDFTSDKEDLVISGFDGESDTVEIRRLTNKEFWFDDDNSDAVGNIWKLEAK